MKQRVVEVTSKHSFIHVVGKEFGVNVEFLDRRWWEFRPRMKVNIPYSDLWELGRIQERVLNQVHLYGYGPYIHIRLTSVDY